MKSKLNVGVLFSGGKDSSLALHYALKGFSVKCLISIISKNPESYMFHTPNIKYVKKQAKAIGIPVLIKKTKGEKEKELLDLKKAIQKAIKKYKIQGVFTGALASVYQASRIKQICKQLGIECFNPLWQENQINVLNQLIKNKFEVVIIGTYGEGLENLLGKKINKKFINKIKKLVKKYKINPAGEGGEFESFILHAPFFQKKLIIKKYHIKKDKEGAQVLYIDKLKLVRK